MIKQLAILGIAVLLLAVGLSGCNETSNILSGDRDKFIGSWEGTKNIIFVGKVQITFFSDGTGSVSDKGMSWELKDNMLSITSSDGEYSFASEYKFLENNTKLQLLGSDLEDIYTKI